MKREGLIGWMLGLQFAALLFVVGDGCAPQQEVRPQPAVARQSLSAQAKSLQVRCDAGDLTSCGELGTLYLRGLGAPRDLDIAAQLLEQSCHGGRADACADLGEVYVDRRHDDAELVQAAQLFQSACQRGSSKGCARFGRSLLHGIGIPPDAPKGIQLLGATCDDKEPEACLILGAFHVSPATPTPDPVAAVRLFEKAVDCGAGHGTLGLMYWKGYGVSRDLERARQLFAQGCRQGDADACFNLAIMCQLGEGGATDHDAAVRHVKRACMLGLERACRQEDPK